MELDKSEKITALTLRLVKKIAGESKPENEVNGMFSLEHSSQTILHCALIHYIESFD